MADGDLGLNLPDYRASESDIPASAPGSRAGGTRRKNRDGCSSRPATQIIITGSIFWQTICEGRTTKSRQEKKAAFIRHSLALPRCAFSFETGDEGARAALDCLARDLKPQARESGPYPARTGPCPPAPRCVGRKTLSMPHQGQRPANNTELAHFAKASGRVQPAHFC